MQGKTQVWTSAVDCVLKSIEKCTFDVERILEFLKVEDNRNHRREFLTHTSRLSQWFPFILFAADQDSNDIFYQKEWTKDIEILWNHTEIVEVDDLFEHFLNLHRAMDYIKFLYSVIPKGIGYESKLSQGFALYSWAALYKVFPTESLIEGELLCNCIGGERFNEIVNFCKSDEMNNQLVDIEGTIEVNKEILIPRGVEEELTSENIRSPDSLILSSDLRVISTISPSERIRKLDENLNIGDLGETPNEERDFPFTMYDGEYNPDENIKIRIVSNKDWGRVNWSTGSLIDKSLDPVTIENIVIDIHGGSFNTGSSAKQYQYTKYMTMKTDWVVFSIDYRLAPEAKFPANLSDWLQGYLWVAYYAEKYLQIKPKSIVFEGDSAGGNLAIQTTHLIIQKNLRIPDKLLLPYPCWGIGKQRFSPSLLLSLDDVILNCSNIWPCVDLYIGSDAQDLGNPYLYTNEMPKEILEKFPKTFIIVLGLDPLKDETLKFTLKLAELGVDVKTIEYKHWYHGLFYQRLFPFNLPIATIALDRACEFIKE